jgi:hypothetical protein
MTAFAIYSVTHIIPSSFIKIIEKLGKYLITTGRGNLGNKEKYSIG